MAHNIKITEEQYKAFLEEDVTLKADVSQTNGDVKQAIKNTKDNAIKSGVNLEHANIEVPAKAVESKMRSSKKNLTESSKFFKFKDFIKTL